MDQPIFPPLLMDRAGCPSGPVARWDRIRVEKGIGKRASTVHGFGESFPEVFSPVTCLLQPFTKSLWMCAVYSRVLAMFLPRGMTLSSFTHSPWHRVSTQSKMGRLPNHSVNFYFRCQRRKQLVTSTLAFSGLLSTPCFQFAHPKVIVF